MNTTENNKIIAEFMGLETINFGETMYLLKWKNNLVQKKDDSIFNFDSDWNWLMEVVEKIESKKIYKKEVRFSITTYAVKIKIKKPSGAVTSPCVFSAWATYGGTEKLKAVYNACIEFIKWHNQQNK